MVMGKRSTVIPAKANTPYAARIGRAPFKRSQINVMAAAPIPFVRAILVVPIDFEPVCKGFVPPLILAIKTPNGIEPKM